MHKKTNAVWDNYECDTARILRSISSVYANEIEKHSKIVCAISLSCTYLWCMQVCWYVDVCELLHIPPARSNRLRHRIINQAIIYLLIKYVWVTVHNLKQCQRWRITIHLLIWCEHASRIISQKMHSKGGCDTSEHCLCAWFPNPKQHMLVDMPPCVVKVEKLM